MFFLRKDMDIHSLIRQYAILFSVWGKIEIINVKTAKQASNILSRLTYRRTKDLNGYELKVGLFEQNESAAGVTNVQSNNASYYYDIFTGFDEAILNMITERMNFQVKETYPTDDKSHGYQLSNGTYVGVIGIYNLLTILFKIHVEVHVASLS